MYYIDSDIISLLPVELSRHSLHVQYQDLHPRQHQMPSAQI